MKHLFGVLLFLAIVIGSIATYKFLVVPATAEIPLIEVVETMRPLKPTVRTGDDPNGVYAIASKSRGEITIYLNSPRSRGNDEDMSATFSIYAVSSSGQAVLKMTAVESMASAKRQGASPRRIFTYKVDFLNDLEPGTNLYVVHEVSGPEGHWGKELEFSTNKAVAVVMNQGRVSEIPRAAKPTVRAPLIEN